MVKYIEQLINNTKGSKFNKNHPYLGGLTLNYLNEIKSATQQGGANLRTNPLKQLTPEEEATVRSKGINPNFNTAPYVSEATGASINELARVVIPMYANQQDKRRIIDDYLDNKIDKYTAKTQLRDNTLFGALETLLILAGGKAISAGIKQEVKSTLGAAIRTYETKGAKAAEKYVAVKLPKVRNDAVKANPSAQKLISSEKNLFNQRLLQNNQSNQNLLTRSAHSNLKDTKYTKGTLDELIDRDYDVISPEEFFKLQDQVDTRSPLMQLYDGKPPAKTSGTGFTTDIPGTGLVPLKDGSLVVKNNDGQLIRIRPEAAKNATKETIEQVVRQSERQSEIDEGLNTLYGATKEGKKSSSFTSDIKDTAEKINTLKDELGVKDKKELKTLLDFIKYYGKILQNSPNAIKGLAVTVANTGIPLYDIYKDYKDYGEVDFGKLASLPISALGGAIGAKYGPVQSLILGQLGYFQGDRLSRAALRRLGFKKVLSANEKREIEQGLRSSVPLDEIDEYFTGQSGRRYHKVGNKIYAFDTGKMINVNDALQDGINKFNYDTAQTTDQINLLEQQKQSLLNASAMGYDIPQEQITEIDNNIEYLKQVNMDNQNRVKSFNITDDYNDEDDLGDQYYKREVQPTEAQRLAQQVANNEQRMQNLQQIMDIRMNEGQQYIDTYFTPENLQVDYYKYMSQPGAMFMTPQRFAQSMKAKAQYEMQMKARDLAVNDLSTLEQLGQKALGLGLKADADAETARNNYVKNIVDQYKAQEMARHNQVQEQLGYGNLAVDQGKLQQGQQQISINQQNAATNAARAAAYQADVERKQQLTPSQIFYNTGQGFAAGQMAGMDPNQMLNLNEDIGRKVAPKAFDESVPTQQEVTNTRTNKTQTQQNLIQQWGNR